MLTDIEIAQKTKLSHIKYIAKKLNLLESEIEYYGQYKAKVDLESSKDLPRKGKLILVTAMSPTKYGEGKTTVSIGLADGLRKIGKNSCLALREPSLGPVFGLKGGATGGGYTQVAPMEDINLHFTGDFHAIENANNLLCAMVDNHIYQGNELNIDKVIIKRCMDMNDRQLRYIVDGLRDNNGVAREDGFDITVASEVMACFCLATDLDDLKRRLGNIIVGYDYKGVAVHAWQLKADGAMTALLKDAFKPNLVQTLEGTPAIIHGGPFANIAHGCNSVVATDFALKHANYVVTEAGFGADLGAEKFLDIKSRILKQVPDAVVLVITCRAVAHTGIKNVLRHYNNLKRFGLNVIVAINKFTSDTPEEYNELERNLNYFNMNYAYVNGWAEGGSGCTDLAEKVVELCKVPVTFKPLYDVCDSTENKLKALARYYGTNKIELSPRAQKAAYLYTMYNIPICVAKTQYSFSDDPELLGAPEDFTLHITDLKYCAGAEFIVAYTGSIMTMPGLPKKPAAENIDVKDGKIVGIF